jgi:signal transduction histidine kinase
MPAFSGLTDSQLASLAGVAVWRTVEMGEPVFEEGDASDGLHVVVSGRLRMYKEADGQPVELHTAVPGESYGELALLDGGARSVTVAALQRSELLVLERESFLRVLGDSPTLLAAVLAQLSDTVRRTSEQLLRGELEQRAVRAEAELERYRALAEMVAGVAHEVNTPLGTVNTAASIVRRLLESPALHAAVGANVEATAVLAEASEAMELLERNVQRAHRLVQDFKKLSVSQIADTLERLDLFDVLDEAIGLFSLDARRAGLELELRNALPGPAASAWTGYRGYMSQVILNLIANARQHAYAEGQGGRVEILLGDALDEQGGEVFEITVRDFGRGIPAAELPRIFEPFFTTARARGGSGLGLSIVNSLVRDALHGQISVRSQENQGTSFTIVVPKEVPA